MKVTSISIFNNLIMENKNKILLLKFTASWCGPCQRIKQQYENLSLEYPDILFTEVDVDEMEDLCQHFNITCMPTFIFLKSHKTKYEKLERIEGSNINSVKITCNKLLKILELEELEKIQKENKQTLENDQKNVDNNPEELTDKDGEQM